MLQIKGVFDQNFLLTAHEEFVERATFGATIVLHNIDFRLFLFGERENQSKFIRKVQNVCSSKISFSL